MNSVLSTNAQQGWSQTAGGHEQSASTSPSPVLQLCRQVPSLGPELLDQVLPDRPGSRARAQGPWSKHFFEGTWKPSGAKETWMQGDYFYLLCADKVKDRIAWLMGKQTSQQTARGFENPDFRARRTTKGRLSDRNLLRIAWKCKEKQHRTLFSVKQH